MQIAFIDYNRNVAKLIIFLSFLGKLNPDWKDNLVVVQTSCLLTVTQQAMSLYLHHTSGSQYSVDS